MSASDAAPALLTTPLNALHLELGARMVPFAGYSMPVQYPSGLMAEHHHTRSAAGLFDVSHMGQLRLVGPDAAAAFETLMPVDVIDLPVGKQRYGLLLNDAGGIIDDLMFVNRDYTNGGDIFVIVNGACKVGDIAHIQARIGTRCQVIPQPDKALLALQGPQAVTALQRLCPGVEKLVFMTGAQFDLACAAQTVPCFITRSGYTGEDGFEISVDAAQAGLLARTLLAQPEVKPIGLGARNSLRLEAGLCLYGNDIDSHTTPVEAGLNWALQKVRRTGGARAGGFPGASKVLAQLARRRRRTDSPAGRTDGAATHSRARPHGAAGPGGSAHRRSDQRSARPQHRQAGRHGLRDAGVRGAGLPRPCHRARQAGTDGSGGHAVCTHPLLPRINFIYFYQENLMTIKYTPDHEWLKIDGATAIVGITHHAQDALGDVVFVDLPEVGKSYAAKDVAGVVESVKAAADVYMPVTGEITEVNEALRADPALANSDPLGAGWFFKVKLANPAELDALMDETSYTSFAANP